MGEKRAVVNVERAMEVVPQGKVLTFLFLPDGKRNFAEHDREVIGNILATLGGADVSGPIALKEGFGLCVPWVKVGVECWLFIQTLANVCPLCQGAGEYRNEAELEILPERCWVCEGQDVVTDEMPKRPPVLS